MTRPARRTGALPVGPTAAGETAVPRPDTTPAPHRGAGDVESFAAFVAARGPALSRTAYLLAGDHAAAEDLVQTALMKLLPRWGRLLRNRAHPGDPEHYVRRVMVNEHVSAWRRAGRGRETLVATTPQVSRPGADAHDESEAAACRVALQSALRQLPPGQRAVVVLRFYEDLSVAETAELLGCSTGTVKSQTSDALDRLRALAPHLDTPDEEAGR